MAFDPLRGPHQGVRYGHAYRPCDNPAVSSDKVDKEQTQQAVLQNELDHPGN